MPTRILHLLDPTTPSDSVNILAHLLSLPYDHHLACLGHRNTANLLTLAGINPDRISWIPSLGWADPAPWRILRRFLKKIQPTHLHAWALPAVLATAMAGFQNPRFATFTDIPTAQHMRLLRLIDRRKLGKRTTPPNPPFTCIASSHTLAAHLTLHGLSPDHLRIIPPTLAPTSNLPDPAALKEFLHIAPTDGPIILHGGEGKNAGQDFAIWTAAILQQLFPKIRLIVREDPRTHALPGVERFGDALQDATLIIPAPHNLPWQALLPLADVFLISATSPIPTGSVLEAMSARIPIVASPIPCLTEILTHRQTALVAKHTGIGIAPPVGVNTIRPRALAARIEEFLTHPALAATLSSNAAAHVHSHFPLAGMLEAYSTLYG